MASIFDLLKNALNSIGGAAQQAASSAKEPYEGHGRAGSGYTPPRLLTDRRANTYLKTVASGGGRRYSPPRPAAWYDQSQSESDRPERVEVQQDIEQSRIDWRSNVMSNMRQTAPEPTNPFGKAAGQTDPALNRPIPNVTPEVREMATGARPLNYGLVTPDYIKDVAKSDGELARNLSERYLRAYETGETPDSDKKTLDDLLLIRNAPKPEDLQPHKTLLEGMGEGAMGVLRVIDNATRLPQETGGKAILTEAASRNYNITDLPPYYRKQLAGETPEGYSTDLTPDPDPQKDAQYRRTVEQYNAAAGRFDKLSKLSTFSDGLNTILSLPSLYTAQQKGLDIETAQQEVLGATGSVSQNILQTGEQAGLLAFRDSVGFINELLDHGLDVSDEDVRSYRTGWSPEQYTKYDQQLRQQGTSLAQIVMKNGLSWSELKDTLDLMRYPAEAQADVARSLGYQVTEQPSEPIIRKTLAGVDANRRPYYNEEIVGQQYVFSVDNPDKRTFYDDLKQADYDLGVFGLDTGVTFADLVMNKHAIAKVGQSKTAMFEDFIGSMFTDPTNYGPLQLIWKPMGKAMEVGFDAGKTVAKAAVKGTAALVDIPLGVKTTLGKLLKRGGDTVMQMTRSDWTQASDFVRYLGSETASSAMWKEKNGLFFGLQSALKAGVKPDGAEAVQTIYDFLPKLQEAAKSGDWGVFTREVRPGAARYVANAFNAAGENLKRIAGDEDALNKFLDNFGGVFDDFSKDEIDQVKKLATAGDTAGLMKWSVDKRVQEAVEVAGSVEKAHQGIALNDIFNHVTNSYGDGIRVLTEKKLGTFGQHVTNPIIQRANEVMDSARRLWTSALLSARPGYNIINYLDNAARLAANGYNPVMSAYDLEDELLKHMSAGQLRAELGIDVMTMGENVQDVLRAPEALIAKANEVGKMTEVKDLKAALKDLKAANHGVPNEVKTVLDERIRALNLAVSRYEAGEGTLNAVRRAANEIKGSVFERQVGAEDRVFQSVSKTLKTIPQTALDKLKEYGKIVQNGDRNLIKQVWDDWIGLGRDIHTEIEAAAKMRVYGAEYLDRYQRYLSEIDLAAVPDLGNVTVQRELSSALHEAITHPNKFTSAEEILTRALEPKPVKDAVRNWVLSIMPTLPEGQKPLLDPLVGKLADWLDLELAHNPEALRDPNRVLSILDQERRYIMARSSFESAEPALVGHMDAIMQPTPATADAIANELAHGGATQPDPEQIIRRLTTIQDSIAQSNDRLLGNYYDVQHTPYNSALDKMQTSLPPETRAHRYELMRDSFTEKFAGEGTYNGESVEVVRTTLAGKKQPAQAILADGRAVPASEVKMTDRVRQRYYDLYQKWDATKQPGAQLLENAGLYGATEKGPIKIYGRTVEAAGAIPPDVARAYTRRMEADLAKHGRELPKAWTLKEGGGQIINNLRYDTADEVIQALASGSGLSISHSHNANLFEALNRTTDNWLTALRLADASSVDELKDVVVGGRTVEDYMRLNHLDPESATDVRTAMNQILNDTQRPVNIHVRKGQNLSNNPKTGESLLARTQAYWDGYSESVLYETRGQWVPTFDPNAPDGQHIVLKRIEDGQTAGQLNAGINKTNLIPDAHYDQLKAVESAKEQLEDLTFKIEDGYREPVTMLDEPPVVNVAQEIEQRTAEGVDPYKQFVEDFPRLRSNDDFVQRINFLRERGSTDITEEQAQTLTEVLDAIDSVMGYEPGTLIKNFNFTDVFPTELGGTLWQKIDLDMPEFHKWFDGSVTTRPDGTPERFYHGTTANFDTFQKGDIGFHFGTADQANDRLVNIRPDKMKWTDAGPEFTKIAQPGEAVLPVYLDVKRPLVIESDAGDWTNLNTISHDLLAQYKDDPQVRALAIDLAKTNQRILDKYTPKFEAARAAGEDAKEITRRMNNESAAAGRKLLQDAGYDGIKYRNNFEGVMAGEPGNYSWIVFDPSQVKSAIANQGTFSPEASSILQQTDAAGAALGAQKLIRDALPYNMVGLFSGSNLNTAAEEIGHGISALLQMPKGYFGEVDDAVRAQLDKDMQVIHEACGAPIVKSETGKPQYTMFQKALKLDEKAYGNQNVEAIRAQARLAEERLAEHWRNYLASGKAPTSKLKEVFDRFKKWIGDKISRKYTSGEGVPIRLKMIFDGWLDKDPDFAKQFAAYKSRVEYVAENDLNAFKQNADNLIGLIKEYNTGPVIEDFGRVINETYEKLSGTTSAKLSSEKAAQSEALNGWLGRFERAEEAESLADLKPATAAVQQSASRPAGEIIKDINGLYDQLRGVRVEGDRATENALLDEIENSMKALGVISSASETVAPKIQKWIDGLAEKIGAADSSMFAGWYDYGLKSARKATAGTETVDDVIKAAAEAGYNFQSAKEVGKALSALTVKYDDERSLTAIMTEFWNAFGNAIKDGEYPLPTWDTATNQWVKPEVEPLAGTFRRGVYKPAGGALYSVQPVEKGYIRLYRGVKPVAIATETAARPTEDEKKLAEEIINGLVDGTRQATKEEIDLVKRVNYSSRDKFFSPTPESAQRYAGKDGTVYYLDVPKSDAAKWLRFSGNWAIVGGEPETYLVPRDIAVLGMKVYSPDEIAQAERVFIDQVTGVNHSVSEIAKATEVMSSTGANAPNPTITFNQALAQQAAGQNAAEEAALKTAGAVYVPPQVQQVLSHNNDVMNFFGEWYGKIEEAVHNGYLPTTQQHALDPQARQTARDWLNTAYGQLMDASYRAQQEAKTKMNTVMMDFNTTYNLDVFMQQGPTVTGGFKPLAVGGIVPFFKFPRMNLESWVNTLSNNPTILHNVARYRAAANAERKQYGMGEQFLPSWPVRVGDQVYSVSPFGFVSLSQLLRPMNPYLSEDASDLSNAIGVAQQAGFSLGPVAKIMARKMGLAPDLPIESLVPQGSALIDPTSQIGRSLISGAPEFAKLIGLTTDEDEDGIRKQMVFDALGDMRGASDERREAIYSELTSALTTGQSPRRTMAEEHYRQQKFMQSNTGYWTGVYPRPYSAGELARLDYKQSAEQMQAAMLAAGLTPEQANKLSTSMLSDPRKAANTAYGKLFQSDPGGAKTIEQGQDNEIERQGELRAYYAQVADLQAQYQQKYGLSGTPIPQEESDKFYQQLQVLNAKYADALRPSSTKRYTGETDQQYQYRLGQSWLEYLKDTKPVFTDFKTYAEYQQATDQWYKDLPKTSAGAWQLVKSLVGQTDELPTYLSDVSTAATMKKYEARYDTPSDAIYRVYTDQYYSGYWDAINGKTGPERLLAALEYKQRHPVPSNQQIIDWVRADETYAKRFSNQDLQRELGAHPVASIEQRYQFGKTLAQRQALEMSDLLARIPPGNAYFKFRDSLSAEAQKHLATYQDNSYTALENPTKWLALYEEVKSAVNQQFPEPGLATVKEWVQAYRENQQMEAERDRLAPGFASILKAYNAIAYEDKTARAAYRKANPEIGMYYDWLYTNWAGSHPIWDKYYGSTETSQAGKTSYGARSGVTYASGGQRRSYSRGGGGGGGYRGGYSSGSGYAASAQSYDKNWQPFQNFRQMAGDALYGRLNDYWSGRGPLSDQETGLLQSLYKQYAFGAKDYTDWLNNVLPGLVARFIPGHDIFKNPQYYDNNQYAIKHYNRNQYWFKNQ